VLQEVAKCRREGGCILGNSIMTVMEVHKGIAERVFLFMMLGLQQISSERFLNNLLIGLMSACKANADSFCLLNEN